MVWNAVPTSALRPDHGRVAALDVVARRAEQARLGSRLRLLRRTTRARLPGTHEAPALRAARPCRRQHRHQSVNSSSPEGGGERVPSVPAPAGVGGVSGKPAASSDGGLTATAGSSGRVSSSPALIAADHTRAQRRAPPPRPHPASTPHTSRRRPAPRHGRTADTAPSACLRPDQPEQRAEHHADQEQVPKAPPSRTRNPPRRLDAIPAVHRADSAPFPRKGQAPRSEPHRGLVQRHPRAYRRGPTKDMSERNRPTALRASLPRVSQTSAPSNGQPGFARATVPQP